MNYYKVFTSLSLVITGICFILLLSNSSFIHHMRMLPAWIGKLLNYQAYVVITHIKLCKLCIT